MGGKKSATLNTATRALESLEALKMPVFAGKLPTLWGVLLNELSELSIVKCGLTYL